MYQEEHSVVFLFCSIFWGDLKLFLVTQWCSFSTADSSDFIGTREPVFFGQFSLFPVSLGPLMANKAMEAREWEVGGKEGSYLKNNDLLMNFS